MSERRRSVDDDDHSLMWEELFSTAYLAHPYFWPVIGWAGAPPVDYAPLIRSQAMRAGPCDVPAQSLLYPRAQIAFE